MLNSLCRGRMLLVILTTRNFYNALQKELQKINQKKLRIEKVIKRKGNKLNVKWKCYNNHFNSRIDKKDNENELIFSTIKIFNKKSEN